MSDFATRLKELRIKRKITQQDLADYLHVSQNAIYNWENGKRMPKMETIEKLAGALGVTTVQLLGLSKEEVLKPLKDEVAYLNFLLSLGYEYVDTFYDNEEGYDRCIYIPSENIDIPLTGKEYEHLRKAIISDTETELYKLRKKKGL